MDTEMKNRLVNSMEQKFLGMKDMERLDSLLIRFMLYSPNWTLVVSFPFNASSSDRRHRDIMRDLYNLYMTDDLEVIGAYWAPSWYSTKESPVFLDKREWMKHKDDESFSNMYRDAVADSWFFYTNGVFHSVDGRKDFKDKEKDLYWAKTSKMSYEDFRPWIIDLRTSDGHQAKTEFILSFMGETEEERLKKMVSVFRPELVRQMAEYAVEQYEETLFHFYLEGCDGFFKDFMKDKHHDLREGTVLMDRKTGEEFEVMCYHDCDEYCTCKSFENEDDEREYIDEEDVRRGAYKVKRYSI